MDKEEKNFLMISAWKRERAGIFECESVRGSHDSMGWICVNKTERGRIRMSLKSVLVLLGTLIGLGVVVAYVENSTVRLVATIVVYLIGFVLQGTVIRIDGEQKQNDKEKSNEG